MKLRHTIIASLAMTTLSAAALLAVANRENNSNGYFYATAAVEEKTFVYDEAVGRTLQPGSTLPAEVNNIETGIGSPITTKCQLVYKTYSESSFGKNGGYFRYYSPQLDGQVNFSAGLNNLTEFHFQYHANYSDAANLSVWVYITVEYLEGNEVVASETFNRDSRNGSACASLPRDTLVNYDWAKPDSLSGRTIDTVRFTLDMDQTVELFFDTITVKWRC